VRQPRPPPAFTGLIVYREPAYGCSLLVPEGWHRLDLASEVGGGAIFVPEPTSVDTSFSLEGRDLGTPVRRQDLSALKTGLLAGVRGLPEARIERQEAEALDRLLTLEVRHTYRDGDCTRKRWVRLLYRGSIQVRLIAQGADEAEFTHWEPMFFQMMRTFRFGDWWSEVTGEEWLGAPFTDRGEGLE
jgi:hypothetical protein